MRIKFSLLPITIIFLMLASILGCKKDPPKLIPSISTSTPTNITASTATCGGNITSDGGAPVSSRGVCWGINQSPTISDFRTTDGTGPGIYSSSIIGLIPNTTYYVRAYASNEIGTSYGNQLSFNASSTIPTLTTYEVTEITDNGANGGGNIIAEGGSPIIMKGLCWSTIDNPTIKDFKSTDGSGNGSFNSAIRELNQGTQYYVRAYATNNDGTVYGNLISFSSHKKNDITSIEQAYPGVKGETVTVMLGDTLLDLKKIGNEYIYQGDIIFHEENFEATKGAGSINLKRWPNNTVFYTINNNMRFKESLDSAINEFESKTNIKFKPRTNEKNFVEFILHPNTSSSEVGMVDFLSINNTIRIAETQLRAGVIMHEICHALGMYHEHSKKGRNDSITIKWINVEVSLSAISNLKEQKKTIVTPGFDFNSIMLYHSKALSRNGKNTMVRKGTDVGFGSQRVYLSASDVEMINIMYPAKPVLSTIETSEITGYSAKSGGIISKDGGYNIISKGVCWSTNEMPNINDNKTSDGSGISNFTSSITGLSLGVTYYIRAYAINSSDAGPGYGDVKKFTTGLFPVAAFTATPTTINAGQSVQFTDQSTNTPTSWSWSFGDQATSTTKNPSHIYSSPGNYTVTLTATSSLGSNTLAKTNYITVNFAGSPPVAAFTATPTTITPGQSVQFTDQSTNTPSSWFWNFGDGSTSTTKNPSHIYTSAGTYTVILTATNSYGYNLETKTNYITVSSNSGILFNPNLTYGSVTDIDGNVYKTILIGTQTWMAENLKTTKYRDGIGIPNLTDNSAWIIFPATPGPGYCWYNNDINNKSTYGALYNWYTGNTGKLCPTGWHVPGYEEWTALTEYLGGFIYAGWKLIETGTTHWTSLNTGSTNESGFTALPGGSRQSFFAGLGVTGSWWSTSEMNSSTTNAWNLHLYSYNSAALMLTTFRTEGLSVRCVKD